MSEPIGELDGIFSIPARSTSILVTKENCNITVTFGAGVIYLEKSYDEGVTWHQVRQFTESTEAFLRERESNVLYSFNCTHVTSQIRARLSY